MQAAYDAAHIRERAADITKGLKRIETPAAPLPDQPRMF
jgi:hypothetical protein